MPTIADRVYDFGLTVLDTEATTLHICTAEPTTFTQAATTFSIGNKALAAGDITLAAGSPNGRQANLLALSGGNVTASGTAAYYAVLDTANSRLLLTGALAAGVVVVSGSTFTTPAIALARIPAAV